MASSVEWKETAKKYVINVNSVQKMRNEDLNLVNVKSDGRTLVVSGHRKSDEVQGTDADHVRVELISGSHFRMKFRLALETELSAVGVEVENGVLIAVVPKKPEALRIEEIVDEEDPDIATP